MRRNPVLFAALSLVLITCHREKPAEEHASHTSAPAPAPESAKPEPIRFGDASGYLATPQTPAPKNPALIVIHEWWGLDNWVREQTDRFAGQGYVALAPDLYRGKTASTPEEAHELMRGLPEDRAMADLKAAFDLLAARPDVDPQRIGVIGWCMGGGYALAFEIAEPRLAATNINYGRLVTDFDTIAKISSPILGNFGGADRGIPAEDVKAFGAKLTQAGKLGDIKVYDGAGHAFMNPNNKEGYNAEATADAWRRIDSFFDRHLRAKIPNS